MMVLLGAGASAPLDVPTAVDMTRRMLKKAGYESLEGFDLSTPFHARPALGLVVGELQAARLRRGDASGAFGINVEDVFNAVAMLAERDTIDAAPFVGQWRREVQEVDRITLGDEDVQMIRQALYATAGGRLFGPEEADVDAFAAAVRISLEAKGRAFELTLDWMVRQLFDFTYIGRDKDLANHRKFAAQAYGLGATVATLNYDNSIELAATLEEVPCSVGVGGWPATGEINFEEGRLPLLKLHGSILWWKAVNASKAAGRLVPHHSWGDLDPDIVRQVQARSYGSAVLIFGGRNKLTADGPYLDLLAEFRRRLWLSDELRVVGYSLGDGHINHTVARWLETGPSRVLRIYDVLPEQTVRGRLPEPIAKFGRERVSCVTWQRTDALSRVFE